MGSGDEIKAGQVTTAESTTDILGAVPSERDVDFNGGVILRVAPQPGDLRPNITLDGIHGVGSNGAVGSVALPGGTGVIGFGGPNEGTGIAGHGGGIYGSGGIGVHGIGGSRFAIPSFDPSRPSGAGVVGQGGRMDDSSNFPRLSHGAGVIAIAGGSNKPIPPLADTGSVGVYAQGAEAEVRKVNIDNVDTIVGPIAPGSGVLGRGGVPIPREGPVAAGVIGLAGDTAIPPISKTGNTGVFGSGPVGVFGHGSSGRGGVFESDRSAQVQLVPRNLKGSLPDEVGVTPKALQGEKLQAALPKDGRGGDLIVIEMDAIRNTRVCTLWFCVQSATKDVPARWGQVLVGPSFDGLG